MHAIEQFYKSFVLKKMLRAHPYDAVSAFVCCGLYKYTSRHPSRHDNLKKYMKITQQK